LAPRPLTGKLVCKTREPYLGHLAYGIGIPKMH